MSSKGDELSLSEVLRALADDAVRERIFVRDLVEALGDRALAALMLVFRLVIDATRGPSVFMRQALLDPVAIEAQLIQQGRTCAP